MTTNCIFCTKLCNLDSPDREWYDEILWYDELFVVTPALGAFVEGYVMLTVRDHYNSLAEAPAQTLERLEKVLPDIRRRLSSVYGPVVAFEHGAGSRSRGGSCIDHAHLHFVPYGGGIDQLIDSSMETWPIDGVRSLKNVEGSPYVLFCSSDGRTVVAEAPDIPGQYMRRKIAEAVGCRDEWDYHTFPYYDIIEKGLAVLRPVFAPLQAR